ncbi:MAG: hypothetical protein HY461_02065, partial [Parcubacteria group bacterium]|nr:hypothetical protein [Parcubacteria group bacterium]
VPYLTARGLLKQYTKAKRFLLHGNLLQVRFKERNPKGSGIWYFRINKQYRALGVFDADGDLIIFKIDNHQQTKPARTRQTALCLASA